MSVETACRLNGFESTKREYLAAEDEGVDIRRVSAQALARIAGMPAVASRQGQLLFLERIIYPMPTPGGLGVHLTLDLARQAKFGPDVEWVEAIEPAEKR